MNLMGLGKVTHDFIHLEMYIVGDDVSGNINMSGDCYAGGEKLLCEKDSVPQQKISTRDKRFKFPPLYFLMAIQSCVL